MNVAHLKGLYRQERIDSLILAYLDPAIAKTLGAKVTRVYLSRDTMDKQLRRHPELQIHHYTALCAAIMLGEIRQQTPSTAMILFVDTKYTGLSYRAHLKVVSRGREIYADSFCILGGRQHRSDLRKPLPILRPHLSVK